MCFFLLVCNSIFKTNGASDGGRQAASGPTWHCNRRHTNLLSLPDHFLPAGKPLRSLLIRIYSHLIVRSITIENWIATFIYKWRDSLKIIIWQKKKQVNRISYRFWPSVLQMENERHRSFRPFLWGEEKWQFPWSFMKGGLIPCHPTFWKLWYLPQSSPS